METINLTYEEGVAVLMLNRPHKRNAVNRAMISELKGALDDIRSSTEVKAMVLTAEGPEAFCAGGDLKELHGDLTEEEAYSVLTPMREVLYNIATLPVPTLAYLNGSAQGGGCELASACDLRYGKNDDYYGFIQGSLGIVPGWGGGVLLQERIGASEAMNWLIRSEMISSEQAHRIGWLQKITEEEDYFFLKKMSPEQLLFWKTQILSRMDVEKLHGRMVQETLQAAKLWESEMHKEAVRAFFNGRRGQ
ncbi:enoyl-CoA hydratase/isomerase family protein [Salimicrobium halophilum]|uniref:Enoyl-CoA hydratase/carnithine racemase n=1 Tax=Salimicrobium halophilum TaxID=86666 RepID=A0A1G8QGV6_9BACI|nr:enoyl-CoA hydratase/isomerase family protein [Salimicrobium halophilum]SDJ03803.1 Enoyl-CoA hydratase/carnithine racemase [Salimicrobium halophilum]